MRAQQNIRFLALWGAAVALLLAKPLCGPVQAQSLFQLPDASASSAGIRATRRGNSAGLTEAAARLAAAGAMTGLAFSAASRLEPLSQATAAVGNLASDSGHGHGHGH